MSGGTGSGDASRQPHPMLAAPTEACASVAARGTSFSAVAGDLTLPWLGQLGDFFSVGCAADPPEDPPPPPLDLDVHLRVLQNYQFLCWSCADVSVVCILVVNLMMGNFALCSVTREDVMAVGIRHCSVHL